MRPNRIVLVSLLLGVLLVGCGPAAGTGPAAPAAPSGAQAGAGAPPSVPAAAPAPSAESGAPAGPAGSTGAASALASPTLPPLALPPLPAGPCVPGATAVNLPSPLYGPGDLPRAPAARTSERPWLEDISAEQPGVRDRTLYMLKGGTATVDVAEFWLRSILVPAPSPDWYAAHVVLEGIEPLAREPGPHSDYGGFGFHLPAGRPGDAFRLTVRDVLLGDGSSADVTVTFCRQAPPTASVSYKDGTQWRPATEQVPAAGPQTLRVAFTQDMQAESVERSLTGPHDKQDRSQGDWITSLTWIDSRTLEVVANPPVPVMRFNLVSAQDSTGLYVSNALPNLYASPSPQVVALDVATGQEQKLADLAPEPNGAALSPDGKLLRYTSWQMVGGAQDPTWQHWLVDLTNGGSRSLQPQELQGTWLDSGAMLSLRPEGENSLVLTRQGASGVSEAIFKELPPLDSFQLSPDGKSIAVTVRTGHNSGDNIGVNFLILSTDGKSRTPLAGEARMWRPGKDGLTLYSPAWSPDSTRIAFTQSQADGTVSLMLADVAAEALRALVPTLPGSRGSFDAVTWSPDSRKILAGSLLIDAATGAIERRIDGVLGKPSWSPDGQWLLFPSAAWADINAYNLRTEQRHSLGEGDLLGYRPDGTAVVIRWANSRSRLIWGL